MSKELIRKVTNEINATIIMHPRFEQAYQGLLDIIDTASYGDLPFGATVIAPPGCGKTALTKAVARAIPSCELLKDDLRSISVTAEANAALGHFVKKLLKQLGYPTTVRASTLYDQSSIIAAALRERGVKVLFLDEFQHVCRGQRSLSAAAITYWIKQLADEGGVVVILLGTRELKPLTEMNDQLGSRAPAIFELREFQYNDEWIGVLKQFAVQIRSFNCEVITELAKPIRAATHGTLRTLKQLLLTSTKAAIESNKSALDQESLCIGFARAFGTDSRTPNPFLK